ncbi:MAG: VOC family protein [Gammaproteobacteria bacterium]|nr:VOC family protein [Gammaproteobacteria bacterium]
MLKSLFPVFVTDKLDEAKRFYETYFAFVVVFQTDWYVQLHATRSSYQPLELAFMLPGLREQPEPVQAAFSGKGVILTVEVDDVDASYRGLNGACAITEFVCDIRDEPWGQRHFMFRDPAGILVDVFQLIPPSSEYENAYSDEQEQSDS